MRKITTLVALLLLFGGMASAQQDAMFTKYMFNSLIFNPAYAGSKDHMALGLLHRTQWWNLEGAPTTQTLTAHTPLRNDRVGVGISLYNDVIGPTNNMGANLDYAYRIPMGDNGKLSIGIRGSIINWRADWTRLNLPDATDPTFQDNVNVWQPNFGAGIYYYSKHFYVGASSPNLIEYDKRENIQTAIWAKGYRHYFFTIGGAIPIRGDALIFKPSILVKNVGLDKTLAKDQAFQNIS
ncbi:MAG: type IX secretion system membrane protein PorP/SprF, partial [Bacteroidota bacterium]